MCNDAIISHSVGKYRGKTWRLRKRGERNNYTSETWETWWRIPARHSLILFFFHNNSIFYIIVGAGHGGRFFLLLLHSANKCVKAPPHSMSERCSQLRWHWDKPCRTQPLSPTRYRRRNRISTECREVKRPVLVDSNAEWMFGWSGYFVHRHSKTFCLGALQSATLV